MTHHRPSWHVSSIANLALGLVVAGTAACGSSQPPPPAAAPVCPTLPSRETEPEPEPEPIAPAPITSRCGLPQHFMRPEWPTTLGSTSDKELDPAPRGAVSLVLIADTQYYVRCRYPHLQQQSLWIAAERERRHLLGAIALGDLTDENTPEQWQFVRDSLSPVPPECPLLLTTGNHDLGQLGTTDSRQSLLSSYFATDDARLRGALRTTMEPGNIENAFYSLGGAGFRLGVLMLEWSPRRATVNWANGVLQRYRDHRVIIATHAYLYDDETRYDHATRANEQEWNPLSYPTARGDFAADGNHDGEMLWNSLVRKHANVFLVVSGHVLGQGTGHLTSRGDAGNIVHQLLANYQMLDEGGLGYLRLLELYPDGKTIHVRTFSPSLGLYSYAAGQDYRLQVEPPLFAPAPTPPEPRP